MAKQYTGKERVLAACKGEYADRVPIHLTFPRAYEFTGFTAEDCVFNPDKALQAQLKAHEVFPTDMVGVPGNPYLPTTSAATYSQFTGGEREKPRLEDKSALAEMAVRDPRQSRRYSKYLEMCHKTREAFKDEWVYALTESPWSIAAGLRGIENLIYDTMDDPQFVHEVLRFTSELARTRGDALIETGATLMMGDPSASCGVISPAIYTNFVHDYLKGVIDHFKRQNAWVNLHICGYTEPILEYTTSLNIDAIDIDGPTSLKKAVEASQKKVVIRGNLAAELIGNGTKDEVEAEVKKCIEIAAPGSAYILSQGCTIPHDAPMENIRAFWEAGVKYGCYQN